MKFYLLFFFLAFIIPIIISSGFVRVSFDEKNVDLNYILKTNQEYFKKEFGKNAVIIPTTLFVKKYDERKDYIISDVIYNPNEDKFTDPIISKITENFSGNSRFIFTQLYYAKNDIVGVYKSDINEIKKCLLKIPTIKNEDFDDYKFEKVFYDYGFFGTKNYLSYHSFGGTKYAFIFKYNGEFIVADVFDKKNLKFIK